MKDGEHLLVTNHLNNFLYNMKTGVKKEIALANYNIRKANVLENGQVLIQSATYSDNCFLIADFDKIHDFKSGLIQQKFLVDEIDILKDIKSLIINLFMLSLVKEQPSLLKLFTVGPVLLENENKPQSTSCSLQ